MENGVKGKGYYYILLWTVGVFWTLLGGHLASSTLWNFLGLDFITILVAYLYLTYGGLHAAGFAIGQGIVVDIFSAGPVGFFLTLYLAVCGAVILLSRLFDLSNPKGQCFINCYGMLIKKALFFLLLYAFSYRVVLDQEVILLSVVSVLVTGLFAPFFFAMLDLVKRRIVVAEGMGQPDVVGERHVRFEEESLRDIEKIRP